MTDMKYLKKECFLCNDTECYVANHSEGDDELDTYDLMDLQILCANCYEKQQKNITLLESGY